MALADLGARHIGSGRYVDAEALFKESLAIQERILGPDHTDVAVALNFLSEIYYRQERYREAELPCRRALEIRQKALGPHHADVAFSLNNLGEIHRATNRYVSAARLFKQALAIFEMAPAHQPVHTASVLNNLAALYVTTGYFDEAAALYTKALEIARKTEAGFPQLAAVLNNLAISAMERNKHREAERLLLQLLSVQQSTLGARHPDTLGTLKSYAVLLRRTKRKDRAIEIENEMNASVGSDWKE
jgi:tetratricopeptide (TPR) repeat protein